MSSPSDQPNDFSTVNCAQLEKYLKAGMWRLADQETRKLLYVACGNDPKDQQYALQVSLIPCADLQAIDRLWVQYSKGKFGFSVQRSIWLTCEKKFFNKTEAWSGFGDRVGWRINHLFKQNYWKKHGELEFSLKAPTGHLPHMGEKFSILTVEQFSKLLADCQMSG